MTSPDPLSRTPALFTFHECLGEGGFGEVYRATVQRPEGEHEAAVKVLHVERQKQRAAVDRLRDEAKMLAVLQHPAILRFQDFTRIDGRLSLVTEYVEGIDLAAFETEDNPMPLKVALEVVAQVASALLCALTTPSPETGNPLGLIHRDVKPHNIRISRHGEVRLLDFGIARTSELSRDAQTWIGEILCTPGYASPELLCGDPSGHASDVYALGVTLFALLAHEPFHLAKTIPRQRKVAILRDRYTGFLQERMEALPELPEPLVDLLGRMLAYDYADRPDAAEVDAVLREVAATLDGPGLEAWSVDLPAQPRCAGDLCGRTIEETPIGLVPTAVPLSSRRTLPTVSEGMGYSLHTGDTPPPSPYASTPAPAARLPDPEPPAEPVAGATAKPEPEASARGLPTWLWVAAPVAAVLAGLAWFAMTGR